MARERERERERDRERERERESESEIILEFGFIEDFVDNSTALPNCQIFHVKTPINDWNLPAFPWFPWFSKHFHRN